MPDIGLIIFARMDSTRLPGKALISISGRPLLGRVIDRARHSPGGNNMVIATSDRSIDDIICSFAESEGVSVYRGDAEDVAGRALACAEKYKFSRFVRVTGDSPFIDPVILHKLSELAVNDDLDLATNVFPRSFPIGVSGEVIALRALRKVIQSTEDPLDREHITRYFYNKSDKFKIRNLSAEDDRYLGMSISVDKEEDIDKVAWVINNLSQPADTASLEEIVRLVKIWNQH